MNTIRSRIHFNVKIILIGIILIHILLLSRLIFFPYPELFLYPYLVNNGLLPYAQIWDQHTPALLFLPLNFGTLGMLTPDIARIWLAVAVFLTHLGIYLTTHKLLKNHSWALLANIAYFIWQPLFGGWIFWIDSLLPLFLLPAFYIWLSYSEKSTHRHLYPFLIGFLISLLIIFKQSFFPLAGVFLLLLVCYKKSFREMLFFCLGFWPLLLMVLYILKIGVLMEFGYWTGIFNLNTYAKEAAKLPTISEAVRILGVFGSVTILPYINKKISSWLILIITLMGLLIALGRFDLIHLQPVLPFAALSLTATIYRYKNYRLFRLGLIIYLLVFAWWGSVFLKGHNGQKVFFYDSYYIGLSNKINQLTSSKEEIFVYGPTPSIYYLSDTMPAGKIFVYLLPWYMKVSQDELLSILTKNPPKIVVVDRTAEIDGQKIVDFTREIDRFISQDYVLLEKYNSAEILINKSHVR